jgi:flavin reductase (DIM6/NTAB) family NADH-FMN oxidoreductase RutF
VNAPNETRRSEEEGLFPADDCRTIVQDDYKALMRHLAGAVTVVTAGKPGERRGLTATAICSLSVSPPTLLACVNRQAGAHDLIISDRVFSVNVLASDQESVAGRFSGQSNLKGEERFASGTWGTLLTGAPILAGALASLDCELIEYKSVATHTIFIGRVVSGCSRDGAEPLIYLRGAYHTLRCKF